MTATAIIERPLDLEVAIASALAAHVRKGRTIPIDLGVETWDAGHKMNPRLIFPGCEREFVCGIVQLSGRSTVIARNHVHLVDSIGRMGYKSAFAYVYFDYETITKNIIKSLGFGNIIVYGADKDYIESMFDGKPRISVRGEICYNKELSLEFERVRNTFGFAGLMAMVAAIDGRYQRAAAAIGRLFGHESMGDFGVGIDGVRWGARMGRIPKFRRLFVPLMIKYPGPSNQHTLSLIHI